MADFFVCDVQERSVVDASGGFVRREEIALTRMYGGGLRVA